MYFNKMVIAAVFLWRITTLAFANDCFETSIQSPTPFMGNNGEIFKLSDGSIWEVKNAYEYLYTYYPDVIICPTLGKISINGKTINVKPLGIKNPETKPKVNATPTTGVIESQISGEFNGWDGETIFKLTNGQIWQQASYAYSYSYKYRPKVLILAVKGGYQMQVEGMDSRIWVVRIK